MCFLSANDKNIEHLQFDDTDNSILPKTCRSELKYSHGLRCKGSVGSTADYQVASVCIPDGLSVLPISKTKRFFALNETKCHSEV